MSGRIIEELSKKKVVTVGFDTHFVAWAEIWHWDHVDAILSNYRSIRSHTKCSRKPGWKIFIFRGEIVDRKKSYFFHTKKNEKFSKIWNFHFWNWLSEENFSIFFGLEKYFVRSKHCRKKQILRKVNCKNENFKSIFFVKLRFFLDRWFRQEK